MHSLAKRAFQPPVEAQYDLQLSRLLQLLRLLVKVPQVLPDTPEFLDPDFLIFLEQA